jgi:GDPmannose 4,6-dehydratase
LGSITILEALKHSKKQVKFYQASSSEMFGGGSKKALNEESVLNPKSPYGASKVFAHDITKIYRDSYGIFGVNGILFNHESPLRGETFVTRKISKAVGRISMGIQEKLTLGNLNASRDWGYAKDYVEGVWKMMQYESPEDWVLATGVTKTVQDFAKEAFAVVNLNWEDYVITSEKYYRPNEVDYLLGDASKAKKILGWEPSVTFKQLVKIMVDHDINEAKKDVALLKDNLIAPTWEYPKNIIK